jgi:hypothetical protein
MSLRELEQFGEEADDSRFPCIAVGGVILPGESTVGAIQPGEGEKGGERQGTQTRSEARSETGSRERSPAETTSGAEAHPFKCGLIERELGELKTYHPATTVIFSSSSFVVQSIPIRLFSSLPYRARLFLEIPRVPFFLHPECDPRERARSVPDVRAWAFWGGQSLIRSHHQFPDGSMCAYMPFQGLLGAVPLHEIAGMCICWVGKCLYNQVFDCWPGPQHYGSLAMRLRDRPKEFCGCGANRRYEFCHRSAVERAPLRELFMQSMSDRMTYARDLRSQHRPQHSWSRSVPGGLRR